MKSQIENQKKIKVKGETSGAEMGSEKDCQLRTGYYLIHLLKSVLNGTCPDPIPDGGVTIKELYRMAKRHNVDYIAYTGASRVPDIQMGEYEEKWQTRSMKCAMQGVIQLAERDKLYRILPEAGVRILPLKGCFVKEMYPKPEYRQMADLDMLIDEENAEKVREVMEQNGYDTEEFGKWHHDGYRKKPWCTVEIHRNMLPKAVKNQKKYKNIWDRAYEEVPDSGVYRLNWSDFYIYMLEHFAKHFRGAGSGIRSVMDIYVFLQKKGSELDREYLKKQLKMLDLWEFKEKMEQIAEHWFGSGTAGGYPAWEQMIICAGAYGTKELYYASRMEYYKERYHFTWAAKLHYLSEMVFLDFDGMSVLYPVLDKVPILLPFCWIHRILRILLRKRSTIKETLSEMKEKK